MSSSTNSSTNAALNSSNIMSHVASMYVLLQAKMINEAPITNTIYEKPPVHAPRIYNPSDFETNEDCATYRSMCLVQNGRKVNAKKSVKLDCATLLLSAKMQTFAYDGWFNNNMTFVGNDETNMPIAIAYYLSVLLNDYAPLSFKHPCKLYLLLEMMVMYMYLTQSNLLKTYEYRTWIRLYNSYLRQEIQRCQDKIDVPDNEQDICEDLNTCVLNSYLTISTSGIINLSRIGYPYVQDFKDMGCFLVMRCFLGAVRNFGLNLLLQQHYARKNSSLSTSSTFFVNSRACRDSVELPKLRKVMKQALSDVSAKQIADVQKAMTDKSVPSQGLAKILSVFDDIKQEVKNERKKKEEQQNSVFMLLKSAKLIPDDESMLLNEDTLFALCENAATTVLHLNAKCEAYIAENTQLKTNLKIRIEAIEQNNVSLMAENTCLKTKLDKANNTINHISTSANNALNKLGQDFRIMTPTDVDTICSNSHEVSEKIKENYEKLMAENTQLKTDLAAMTESRNGMIDTNGRLESTCEKLMTDYDQVVAENTQLRSDLNNVKTHNDKLHADFAHYVDAKNNLDMSMDILKGKYTMLETSGEKLMIDYDKVVAEKGCLTLALEYVQDENTRLSAEIKDLMAENDYLLREIDYLRADIDKLEKENSDLLDENEDVANRYNSIFIKNRTLNVLNASLEFENNALGLSNNNLLAENEQLKKEESNVPIQLIVRDVNDPFVQQQLAKENSSVVPIQQAKNEPSNTESCECEWVVNE